MRKFIKYFLIVSASLILFFITIAGIAVWIIFTPEKITPIVNKQLEKQFTCHAEVEKVDLTFFSTFPKFGLKLQNTNFINPFENAQSDTLLNVNSLIAAVDIRELVRNNELILSGVSISDGFINAYTDSLGNSNFDILITDTTKPPDDTAISFNFIDIGNVKLNNIDISFIDESLNTVAEIKKIYADINAKIIHNIIDAEIDLKCEKLVYQDLYYKLESRMDKLDAGIIIAVTEDGIFSDLKLKGDKLDFSDDITDIKIEMQSLDTEMKAAIFEDSIYTDILMDGKSVFVNYAGEVYLDNSDIHLNVPSYMLFSSLFFRIYDGIAGVNELNLGIDGFFQIHFDDFRIESDIDYKIDNWPLKSVLAMIPEPFQVFLEGIDADGLISSKGKISGTLNDSLMPVVDMNLNINNGKFNYPEILPLELRNINGDINLYTDFINDNISYLRINDLKAATKKSNFETRGTVRNLYSDVYPNLAIKAWMDMDEFNIFFPDTMNLSMKGRVLANLRSSFYLSQLEQMKFDKIKVSGNAVTNNLMVNMDSIWFEIGHAALDFSLPNNQPLSPGTKFASLSMNTDKILTGKIDDYEVFINNLVLSLETSDILDTTKMPEIITTFSIDTVSASMDTIFIALKNPSGKANITTSPNPGNTMIKLEYSSDDILADMGDISAFINKFKADVDLVSVPDQEDFFKQWILKGFLDLSNGQFNMPDFEYPIEIPAVKMNFDQDRLDIFESRVILDKSDFNLSGVVSNLASYLSGDSILIGRLKFESVHTDVLQLMQLTSGIGVDDEELASTSVEITEKEDDEPSLSGPFIVPQGIDISLTTDIKRASFGNDTASAIIGEVRISDGILVLDNLRFTTPAARMQLTAMHRTPRKNHLFLGIDYHMLDIEIEELLQLIPDIDSLMPMLRSFRGKAEFHIAVECYLDSTYNIKKSTLRGASSIAGQNLVLLDGETFTEIAKTLRFTKKAENKIDSLSAEFTIFREEIDIYPFLIVMDRYSVVVAGRHNFDMSFDYHITVVESPLPARLGVDIRGNMEDLNFRLAQTRYPEFYKPASRGAVQSNQLELRQMIRNSLLERVVE